MIRIIDGSVANSSPSGHVADLAHHLFFDDVLVALHPLAVKRRDEQLATLPVRGAVEAERRAGAEHLAEGACAGDQIGVRR